MKKHTLKVLLPIVIGLILSTSVSFLEGNKNVENNQKQDYIGYKPSLGTNPPGPPPPGPPGGGDVM